MAVSVPEGWKVNNFSVKLKDGKPEGATAWFDVQGRPVALKNGTWSLHRQPAPAPRKLTPQEASQKRQTGAQKSKPAPPRKLTPQEIQQKGGGQKAQAPQPDTDSGGEQSIKPEEREYYKQFSSIAKEKIEAGTRKSFYPDPEQAKRDEENRRRQFAPYIALSEDQLSAIGAYTSEWDLNMNSLLREGSMKFSYDQILKNKETPSEAQVKKAIADLTSALESLPAAPEATYSRAVSGSLSSPDSIDREATQFIKQLQALEPGDTLEDPGFSSFTSGGAPVIDRFLKGDRDSNQNIVFEVKSGGMKNISPISKYENEKEHMLPPGTKFRVVGKRTGYSRNVGNHTVIELEHLIE